MATTSAPAPMAQDVGNAFVEQYYHILHQSPELVYKFYQNSSVVGRPGSNGVMTSVTTMSAINDMILALDSKDRKAEIKTVDAQNSLKGGVVVLVTGCLTMKDNVGNKFTQSFFLAPQEKGYFVLNDVLRYVDENDAVNISVSVDETSESTTPIVEEQLNKGDPAGNVEEEPVVVELPVQSIQTEVSPITEPAASVVQEHAPEKSNASSIVSLIYRMSSSFRVWHVVLPPEVAKLLPKNRLLSENEWRAIGVQQSRGWVHYAIHRPEPHIMLFRRTLNYQQQQESNAQQMLAK